MQSQGNRFPYTLVSGYNQYPDNMLVMSASMSNQVLELPHEVIEHHQSRCPVICDLPQLVVLFCKGNEINKVYVNNWAASLKPLSWYK